MANVTYLLGAGASANALPVVNELSAAIDDVITALSHYNLTFSSNKVDILIEYEGYKKKAIDELKKLLDGCLNHLSIDTYAKMLFLTGNKG